MFARLPTPTSTAFRVFSAQAVIVVRVGSIGWIRAGPVSASSLLASLSQPGVAMTSAPTDAMLRFQSCGATSSCYCRPCHQAQSQSRLSTGSMCLPPAGDLFFQRTCFLGFQVCWFSCLDRCRGGLWACPAGSPFELALLIEGTYSRDPDDDDVRSGCRGDDHGRQRLRRAT